jgi:uncharacterized membrane protein YeaQ/YmgE (transglycosylase-associated protein family)
LRRVVVGLPTALLAGAALGLLASWLRPGGQSAGYVSLVVLGIVAAVVIQPLVALLRLVADTFQPSGLAVTDYRGRCDPSRFPGRSRDGQSPQGR